MISYFENLLKYRTVLAIVGPTASGKTKASIELSKLINIEVISADSRQVFKYLNIGTAKPTSDELNAVKTYFIDYLEPDSYISAGRFAKEAQIIIEQIFKKNKLPVVVGGTGLYIQALCEGIFEDKIDENQRKIISDKLSSELELRGIDFLYEKLKFVDKVSAEKYSDKNPRRILRALEYYEIKGIPFSEAQKKFMKKSDFNVCYFGIEFPRNELYERINRRTEIMWSMGLVEEVKEILKKGYSANLNSLNTVGYKETIAFLRGEMNEIEAIEKIKQNTRRYAKRQMTWFRKNSKIKWLSGDEKSIAELILQNLINI
jgi:tRNA dimethylallyltransferase